MSVPNAMWDLIIASANRNSTISIPPADCHHVIPKRGSLINVPSVTTAYLYSKHYSGKVCIITASIEFSKAGSREGFLYANEDNAVVNI